MRSQADQRQPDFRRADHVGRNPTLPSRLGRISPLLFLILYSTACQRDRYYALGKFREASIMYRTAIKKDPRYAMAYLHEARALLKMDKLGEAIPALRRAVELLPEGLEGVEARVALANIYLSYQEAQEFDKAMGDEVGRLADELIRLHPKSYDGFQIRGKQLSLAAFDLARKRPGLARSQLQEAISALRTADAIRPFQPDVLVPLARCLWAGGQPAEAERYLLSAIDHRTGVVEQPSQAKTAAAYTELYRLYSNTGRTSDAEKLLQAAIGNSEHDTSLYSFLVDLAALYQRLGRRSEMAAVLDNLKSHAVDYPLAYQAAGNLYSRSGDFQQAVREYGLGIAAFPRQKAHYQKLIVDALVAGNQRHEAQAVNESILKDNPKDIQSLVRRAGFLFESGEVDKAISQLEALLRQTPNDVLAHYSLGRALTAKGRREQARFEFSEAIRWGPTFIPPRIALAEVQLGTGEYGNAVISAEGILSRDEKNAKAMLILAVALREMGKNTEAHAAFESVLKTYPRFDEALLQFGVLCATEHKTKEAETAFYKSYEVNPGNLKGLLTLVRSRIARTENEAALKILKSETAKYPDRADLRLALADVEMHIGHPDLAIAEYQLLLKKLDKNTTALGEVHLHIAECYKRTGDLQTAVAHLQQARQLLPEDSAVLHNLGVLHDMLGKKNEAKGFYEASLKINGEDGVVLNNLAFYMAENGGDLDQALTYAQRAQRKMPHELAFADTIGVIYMKKNLVENAIEILEKVAANRPDQAVFRLHLAEALLKKGETAKGRNELRTALARGPSLEDTAKIKELLTKTGS
jgi:tetratricopeptide (TPR) repeat protein